MAASINTQKNTKPPTYPEPLVVPSSLTHKYTIIALHGRGSNGQAFGPMLLSTKISDGRTLKRALPHATFVNPTASKRRAQTCNRSIIHQWFDNGSLATPTEREELMIDGLRETSIYIHRLLRETAKEVGATNVVLGGLSQGCAAALVSLLTCEGEPLAAAFGMCGWLPLRQHIADIADLQTLSDHGEDPFVREIGVDQSFDLPRQAIAWIREELALPPTRFSSVVVPATTSCMLLPFQLMPIFKAHGTDDEKVKVEFGIEVKECLTVLQADVTWGEYDENGSLVFRADVGRFGGISLRKDRLGERFVDE